MPRTSSTNNHPICGQVDAVALGDSMDLLTGNAERAGDLTHVPATLIEKRDERSALSRFSLKLSNLGWQMPNRQGGLTKRKRVLDCRDELS